MTLINRSRVYEIYELISRVTKYDTAEKLRKGKGEGLGEGGQAELLETRRRSRRRQVVSGKKTFNCILGQVAWLIFIIAAVIIHNKAAGA